MRVTRDGGARLDLDRLRRRHRELRAAFVLHADDAPGLRREVDPRVEALAAVAAHDRGRRRTGPARRASNRGRSEGSA